MDQSRVKGIIHRRLGAAAVRNMVEVCNCEMLIIRSGTNLPKLAGS
jgi:hypothetical protein